MFWLSTSTVVRLRDKLRAAARRGAVSVAQPSAAAESPETLEAEYGALAEAMYLMMSADGEITSAEHEVLSGALRNLSGGLVDGELGDRWLKRATKRVEVEGREARLADVIATLAKDTARAEVAFVLAAAIAFADDAIADEENETLDALAEGLGIDETRADELLDAVEKDLGDAERG